MESSETELPASPPSDCSLVNPQSASTTASASVTLNHEVSAIKSSSTIAEEVLPLANSGLQLKQAPSHEVNKTQMIQSITAPPSPAGAPPSRAGAQDGLVVPPAVVAPLNGSALAPLGAWVKPLNWLEKSLDQIKAPLEVDWPALSGKCMGKNVHRNEVGEASSTLNNAIPPAATTYPTYKKQFPWTARMNPKSRNLHRVTMPEYMEDGTPKVTIPNHVLLNGLQNQKEYVVGQFSHCLVPSGGLVHAILNKIWGRRCKHIRQEDNRMEFLRILISARNLYDPIVGHT
ncbi:hypothetical protein Bca101_083238 [Brassica carinata]